MSWQLASFALLALAIATGLGWYERSQPTAKLLALVATLAALAALGRIAFAALPNVKPTTDIVLLSGFALGAAPGFAVGAIGALASNLFFGLGPHTPWQMAAWGAAGLLGALTARALGRDLGRFQLAAVCAFAGLAFGAWMDLSLWITYSGHTLAEYGAISVRSVPFNVAHIVGNVAFCLAFGPALVRALMRFRDRFEIVWRPAPARGRVPAAATGAATTMLLVALLAIPATAANRAAQRSVDYLSSAQTSDGGFANARGGTSSNALASGWAVIGLAAAGRHPADVAKGGTSAADYARATAGRVTDTGDQERTVLALRASGLPTGTLAAKIAGKQRANGSWEALVNRTAFGVLALRAAGRSPRNPAVRRAVAYLLREQNRNGGWSTTGRGGPSTIDDTSAVLQALVSAGRRTSSATRRGVSWLVRRQNQDGGFPLSPGTPSNAQSTAWAVQAFAAVRRDANTVRRGGSRSAAAYLRSLQAADGSIRYSRSSAQTPTWVTGQAVAALAERPLPVAPPRRRATAARSTSKSNTPAARPAAKAERSRAGARSTRRTRAAYDRELARQLEPAIRRTGALTAAFLNPVVK